MKVAAGTVAAVLLATVVSLHAGGSSKPIDPEVAQNWFKGLKKGFDDWAKYQKMGKDGIDFLKQYDPLTPEDEDYDSYHHDPGAPQVPSQCAGSDECGGCFEKAHENLNRQRFRLAKLRRIYVSTMRMGKSAIAFGDNVSGIHGMSGLYWQAKGRAPIERQMKQFQGTCRDKYEEIIGDLHTALQEVAACEAQFYGETDWYNRYGFIYYQFMSERYRPDDY